MSKHTKGPWTAARMILCAEACAGMDDPAAEIARLRAGLAQLRLKAADDAADFDALQAERDEATAALVDAYSVLAHICTDFPNRHTIGGGQALLIRLRELAARLTGREPRDVQDSAIERTDEIVGPSTPPRDPGLSALPIYAQRDALQRERDEALSFLEMAYHDLEDGMESKERAGLFLRKAGRLK